jgi:hypothetical protein
MPRACPVEFSRSLLFSWEREPPRPKAVASNFVDADRRSFQRETPRGKPVASSILSVSLFFQFRLAEIRQTV